MTMQQANNAHPSQSLPDSVRVTPSRRQLDNRFPSLCFFVETGALPYFELLLTTDRQLFDPARAAERHPDRFYSSREDVGLLEADDSRGAFHVPPAVLRAFAQQSPRPAQLYYTAIAYATPAAGGARFALPPQQLPDSAPSIVFAAGFTGATLSQVLGTTAERLKTVGAKPTAGPGGLPLRPSSPDAGNGIAPTAQPVPPPSPTPTAPAPTADYPDEGEDGAYSGDSATPVSGGAQPEAAPSPATGPAPARDSQPVPPPPPSRQPAPRDEAELDYDDGYGDSEVNNQAAGNGNATRADSEAPSHGGYGDEDFDLPAREPRQQAKAEPAPQAEREAMPPLDELDGLVPQSLEAPGEPEGVADSANGAAGDASDNDLGGNGKVATDTAISEADKRQLIEFLAAFDSGEVRYAAINPDGEFKGRLGRDHPYYQRAHAGLSFGIGPFSQDSGNLGRLLRLMRQRDPAYFDSLFGPDADELLEVTNAPGPSSLHSEGGRSARVQPVAGSDLWQEPWLERFRSAGAHPPFQAAQNQLAAELYLDPALPYARQLGLNSQRALAMIYDRFAQLGPEAGARFVVEAVSPLRSEAQRSAALAAVMDGESDASLRQFQQRSGLPADGQWNAASHAQLLAELRARRDRGGELPVALPDYEEMLDALVAASRERSWEQRTERLRQDPRLSDQLWQ